MPRFVTIPAHQIELADPRGCYAYMGYLGGSQHCGMHGLCGKCRARTGDAPSRHEIGTRERELDSWLRAELPALGVTGADVLRATNSTWEAFFWWTLDMVRDRNGIGAANSHYMTRGVPDPMPALVEAVARDA